MCLYMLNTVFFFKCANSYIGFTGACERASMIVLGLNLFIAAKNLGFS